MNIVSALSLHAARVFYGRPAIFARFKTPFASVLPNADSPQPIRQVQAPVFRKVVISVVCHAVVASRRSGIRQNSQTRPNPYESVYTLAHAKAKSWASLSEFTLRSPEPLRHLLRVAGPESASRGSRAETDRAFPESPSPCLSPSVHPDAA